jgi:hypothetical protein
MFSPISSEKRRNSIGLGELVAGTELAFQVPIFNGRKFAPVDFHPIRFHVPDGPGVASE